MKPVYSLYVLFLLVAFYSTKEAFSQQKKEDPYYWSSGKKFVLQPDSLTLVINIKDGADKNDVERLLKTKAGVTKVEKMLTANQLVVYLSEKESGKAIERMKSETLSLEDVSYSYLYDSFPLIPTGEILLQPKQNVTIQTVLDIVGNRATVKEATKYNTFALKVKDLNELLSLANQIYESGLVDWCHPDFWAEIVRLQTDPLYPDQYYLNNTGQFGGTTNIDINAPQAWNLSRGLNPVRIAVIDDGVENHEDINGRVLPGFTPRIAGGNGAPINIARPDFRTGHGQACAGIIGATQNNALGITGVYPCARIVPINIFADWFANGPNITRFRETAVDIAAGINWAWDNGQAAVLSNSWGYGLATPNNTDIPNFDAIVQAINNARTNGRGGLGSIVVFASGNHHQTFSGVAFPADVAGVVTVGAIDRNGNIWNYSSRGPEMDLVAPTGNVNNLGDVRTTDRTGANGYVAGNYLNTFGGTSAACPQVSGAAGLLVSINPNLTEAQVINFLTTTATDMGAAGFDNTFGRGRLNVQSAVQSVMNTYAITNQVLMCGSRTYTLTPAPAVPVTWSVNPSNLVTVSTGNGATANLTRNTAISGAQATITFTLQGNCGNTTFSRVFQVGPFNTSQVTVSGTTGVCPGNEYTYTANVPFGHSNAYTYNWTFPSGWTNVSQSANTIRLYVPTYNSQYGAVRVSVNNTCGTTPHTGVTVYPGFSCSGYLTNGDFMIYPNPADEQLTIEQMSDPIDSGAAQANPSSFTANNLNIASTPEPFSVKLYNARQEVVAQGAARKTKVQLDTSKLPPNTYYLHILYKEAILQKQIIIE